MSKYETARPLDKELTNAYTFATAFQRRGYGTRRQGVALFWLSFMTGVVQSRYGKGELNDAAIIKLACKAKLPGTGPWIRDNV
jgi:hypothetical protein